MVIAENDWKFPAENETNFSTQALKENNYLPYLPRGYDLGKYLPKEDPDWKMRSDLATTPSLMLGIYHNLRIVGAIPTYEKPFQMVSFGSNLPTIERFLFDVDRTQRHADTCVTAVDLATLPEDVVESMTVNENTGKKNIFSFVASSEEAHEIERPVDLILNYRAALYYYLRGGMLMNPEVFVLASNLLQKYHNNLSDNGVVVVDARKHIGSDVNTKMNISTGELLDENKDELVFDGGLKFEDLYTTRYVGEGDARVMILRKKSLYRRILK